MSTCKVDESQEMCRRREEMQRLQRRYKNKLNRYYRQYALFLKYSNATGNESYSRMMASRAKSRLERLEIQLKQIGGHMEKAIQGANHEIKSTRTQINLLDNEMQVKNKEILQKQKNIDTMQAEYDTRMQQIHSNIEKNRYRRNVMWVFIISNLVGICILGFLIFKNVTAKV